jgi:hypothetical protein
LLPALAVALNGDLYVAFTQYVQGDQRVKLIASSDDGLHWTSEPFEAPLNKIFIPALAVY